MTGYPNENRPAFRKATRFLRKKGYEVISPDELDLMYPLKKKTWAECLRRDLPHVARATLGVLLPGWQDSRGARLEVHNLTELGCPCYLMLADQTLRHMPPYRGGV